MVGVVVFYQQYQLFAGQVLWNYGIIGGGCEMKWWKRFKNKRGKKRPKKKMEVEDSSEIRRFLSQAIKQGEVFELSRMDLKAPLFLVGTSLEPCERGAKGHEVLLGVLDETDEHDGREFELRFVLRNVVYKASVTMRRNRSCNISHYPVWTFSVPKTIKMKLSIRKHERFDLTRLMPSASSSLVMKFSSLSKQEVRGAKVLDLSWGGCRISAPKRSIQIEDQGGLLVQLHTSISNGQGGRIRCKVLQVVDQKGVDYVWYLCQFQEPYPPILTLLIDWLQQQRIPKT